MCVKATPPAEGTRGWTGEVSESRGQRDELAFTRQRSWEAFQVARGREAGLRGFNQLGKSEPPGKQVGGQNAGLKKDPGKAMHERQGPVSGRSSKSASKCVICPRCQRFPTLNVYRVLCCAVLCCAKSLQLCSTL